MSAEPRDAEMVNKKGPGFPKKGKGYKPGEWTQQRLSEQRRHMGQRFLIKDIQVALKAMVELASLGRVALASLMHLPCFAPLKSSFQVIWLMVGLITPITLDSD